MNNIAILSCWFGEKFNKPQKINSIYDLKVWLYATIKSFLPYQLLDKLGFDSIIPKSPKDIRNCYFYSNNLKLKKEIIDKGWIFCFLDSTINNGESIESSLLAKKVKFLQLNDENTSAIYSFEHLIYMDSRRITDDIIKIIKLNTKGILIRKTPREKTTVWHEVDEAKGQERYAKSMAQTVDFINAKIDMGYSPESRVMNTGVIAYHMKSPEVKAEIHSLCDEVYNACLDLAQPECQIFWCILSQRYTQIINQLDFSVIQTRTGA
ncbi:hypothetical protein [Pseudocolwellia sp. HL-MZ7]|uniref:hypothetical protein n=1 Tax=Pseudocolwellia sp. HL-MZ7 TaxID=3400627 RepID=UPI003CF69C60